MTETELPPNSTNTWATAQDVLNITGLQASDQEVIAAGFIIDLYTGRPYSFTGPDGATVDWFEMIGNTDAYYLKLAVSYQVAWIRSQPDLMGRLDLANLPAKGRPVTVAPDGLTLGPLVKKALGQVSWLRTRSLHVRSPFEDLLFGGVVLDENLFPWVPAGGTYSEPEY